ncbi:MAG: YraN family protein [Candidatus Wallbacteria bacterium]|nr:YraN family protein [Candidatus Wallbacteria bacterium]
MTDRRSLGRAGELAAVRILEREGYRVLQTNFTTRYGEIDIVADEAGCLCFVEVRLKTGKEFGTAQESITRAKRHHLVRAAEIYLGQTGGQDRECRFDVLALLWDRETSAPRSHELIRNAFGADE